jgi:hypothetical protein
LRDYNDARNLDALKRFVKRLSKEGASIVPAATAQQPGGGCAPQPQQCGGSCAQPQVPVVQQQVTIQQQSSECEWEVDVSWREAWPIKQNPVFALAEVHKHEPKVQLQKHEVKHYTFKVEDKDHPCVETTISKPCPDPIGPDQTSVIIKEEPEVRNILRVVQMRDEEPVYIPEFEFKQNTPKDRTAHFKKWREVPIDITRGLPEVDEGECPQATIQFTCHRKISEEPKLLDVLVAQPPPACQAGGCAAPSCQQGCGIR